MLQMITQVRNQKAHETIQQIEWDPACAEQENQLMNLYPDIQYQTITGFGGALTEASGYVFSRMPEKTQKMFLDACFGKEGLAYNLGRISLDSCDFALETYDSLGGKADRTLESFDTARADQYVVPLVKAAGTAAGKPLQILLSPWSPPAFMKTNNSRLQGGKLKEDCAALWAEYMCRYIEAERTAGVDIRMLTVQNEAKAVQSWDSCCYTGAEEADFIRHHLGPALQRHNLENVAVFIWDHNKERAYDRACETLCDTEMERLVSGIAVHWYSGDHFESLQLVRDRFPDKQIIFSEGCVEYSVCKRKNHFRNAVHYAHEIIGDLNHGANAIIDWNVLLDRQGGPNHKRNYCDAPIMYDEKRDELIRNLSWNFIRHFSRYIHSGARRIALTRYTDLLEATAVQNPDGSLAVVVMNATDRDMPLALRAKGKVCPAVQPAQSISTFVI